MKLQVVDLRQLPGFVRRAPGPTELVLAVFALVIRVSAG
jgi:hypothetical protein